MFPAQWVEDHYLMGLLRFLRIPPPSLIIYLAQFSLIRNTFRWDSWFPNGNPVKRPAFLSLMAHTCNPSTQEVGQEILSLSLAWAP
jgi:hypothetical protein